MMWGLQALQHMSASAHQLLASESPVPLLTALLFGALLGWVLPRPSHTDRTSFLATLFDSTHLRRAALAWHGASIVREVWYHWTEKGTFRRLAKAVLGLLTGKGWQFDFPTAHEAGVPAGTPCTRDEPAEQGDWYVTRKDLEFFQRHAEENVDVPGASPWEVMMEKDIPNQLRYTSWRRTLPNGKTEYKSVTYSPDTTAEEYIDLFFDDDYRPNWDTMIIDHEVLEDGDFNQRQQVVRWIRRFPFSFISDREYVLARRLFREGDKLYGITKAVDHPRGRNNSTVVKMDVFYSMWVAQTVPCPWGSGKPACRAVLLHHEQFKIPENLARFAVKHGMWSFVRKLSIETPKFIEQRRKRCNPFSPDPHAYGAGAKPNPPSRHEFKHAHSNFIANALRKGNNNSNQQQQAQQAARASPFAAAGGASREACRGQQSGEGGYRRSATSPLSGNGAASPLTVQSSGEMGGSDSQVAVGEGGAGFGRRGKRAGMSRDPSSTKLKGLAAVALASGIALLMRTSQNNSNGQGSRRGRLPECRSENNRLYALNKRRLRRHHSNAGSDTCLAEVDGL